jgi:hypothetical protein
VRKEREIIHHTVIGWIRQTGGTRITAVYHCFVTQLWAALAVIVRHEILNLPAGSA